MQEMHVNAAVALKMLPASAVGFPQQVAKSNVSWIVAWIFIYFFLLHHILLCNNRIQFVSFFFSCCLSNTSGCFSVASFNLKSIYFACQRHKFLINAVNVITLQGIECVTRDCTNIYTYLHISNIRVYRSNRL